MTSAPTLKDRPVFICGHPKSGTSLLRNLLDSHPQLVVYPEESVFFRRYLPKANNLDLESQLELADKYLIHIFEWNQEDPPAHQAGFPDRDYASVSSDQVKAAMRQRAVQDGIRHIGDVLSAAVLAFGDVTGQTKPETKWWVDKTPYNEKFTRQIFAWWPEARCIHILRDPRDNFASYSRKHTSLTHRAFANNWRESTRRGLRNKKRFGKDRYLLIRYEDLVREPARVLDEICEYLSIEDSRTLRVPTRMGVPWVGNSMFAETFEHISAAPVGRWQQALSEFEVSVIELITGKLMSQLGYQPQAGKRLALRTQVAFWQVRYFLWKLFKRRPQTRLNESEDERDQVS